MVEALPEEGPPISKKGCIESPESLPLLLPPRLNPDLPPTDEVMPAPSRGFANFETGMKTEGSFFDVDDEIMMQIDKNHYSNSGRVSQSDIENYNRLRESSVPRQKQNMNPKEIPSVLQSQ